MDALTRNGIVKKAEEAGYELRTSEEIQSIASDCIKALKSNDQILEHMIYNAICALYTNPFGDPTDTDMCDMIPFYHADKRGIMRYGYLVEDGEAFIVIFNSFQPRDTLSKETDYEKMVSYSVIHLAPSPDEDTFEKHGLQLRKMGKPVIIPYSAAGITDIIETYKEFLENEKFWMGVGIPYLGK